MNEEMADKKVRLTITLSDLAARKLAIWANAHEKTRTAWAAQIVESQIEISLELIEKLLVDCARARGVKPEELEKQWSEQKEDE